MLFRPCIDLRDGQVVQIVGGSLDQHEHARVNHVSALTASEIATLYAQRNLRGGHVIALGAGNEDAACSALQAFPRGLQYGGGVTGDNARQWIDAGASHVIVTSWIFPEGELDKDRLQALHDAVGRDQLVLDLSCRWRDGDYYVVTDRWRHFSATPLTLETVEELGQWCAEFLIHGVDVEGLSQGVDERLLARLATFNRTPITYAGGVRSWQDIALIETAGSGHIDFTVGSSLDLFGGPLDWESVAQRHGPRQT